MALPLSSLARMSSLISASSPQDPQISERGPQTGLRLTVYAKTATTVGDINSQTTAFR